MRSCFIILLLNIQLSVLAQEYFNKIIPFDFGNPTVVGLYSYQDKWLIPAIYPGEISTIVVIDKNLNPSYYHFTNFDFSKRPLTFVNNQMFLYAKDRNQSNDLRLRKVNEEFNTIWADTFKVSGVFSFPTFSISSNSHIYLSSLDRFNSNPLDQEITIARYDTLGSKTWQLNFGIEAPYNYVWEILPSLDGNVLISETIRYPEQFEGHPKLFKLDENGEEIWDKESVEPVDNGAASILIAQLSDSSIVQSYEVDKRSDPDFIINNWDRTPTRFKYYDRNGNLNDSSLVIIPREHELHFYEVESGKGDYFYAYGEYQKDDVDEYYGLIIKFSNTGDTIWTHRYQHPDFKGSDVFHKIKDLEENDNGDIVVLGEVTPVGGLSMIWLFKINEHGCFGSKSCDDIVSSNEEIELEYIVKVFPNPTRDVLHLRSNYTHKKAQLRIFDAFGKMVFRDELNNTKEINVSTWNEGIYFLQVTEGNRILQTDKIIVYR